MSGDSGARVLITNALREHGYAGADRGYRDGLNGSGSPERVRFEFCQCGWSAPGEEVHDAHVAGAIEAALGGLTRGVGRNTGRWVSGTAHEKGLCGLNAGPCAQCGSPEETPR